MDVILCELIRGEKKYREVVEKIKKSGEYIFSVFVGIGFKIRKFICVFVGRYKNAKRVKARFFSIPSSGKHNLIIKRLNCGDDFSKILSN